MADVVRKYGAALLLGFVLAALFAVAAITLSNQTATYEFTAEPAAYSGDVL